MQYVCLPYGSLQQEVHHYHPDRSPYYLPSYQHTSYPLSLCLNIYKKICFIIIVSIQGIIIKYIILKSKNLI